MSHIDLSNDLPGIVGLMAFRPETAGPLSALAETLLRADNTLARGEREAIAAYVSFLNECTFCERSHSAFAARQLAGGYEVVESIKRDRHEADVSPRLRALLDIAALVQQSGHEVTGAEIEAARTAGATDVEIHDTVLIAAAFCMSTATWTGWRPGLPTHARPTTRWRNSSSRAATELEGDRRQTSAGEGDPSGRRTADHVT
jgi:uncharacterized peroxidase-related enzyme